MCNFHKNLLKICRKMSTKEKLLKLQFIIQCIELCITLPALCLFRNHSLIHSFPFCKFKSFFKFICLNNGQTSLFVLTKHKLLIYEFYKLLNLFRFFSTKLILKCVYMCVCLVFCYFFKLCRYIKIAPYPFFLILCKLIVQCWGKRQEGKQYNYYGIYWYLYIIHLNICIILN